MNPLKREEDESLSATEGDQTSRPDVAEEAVVKQTCPGTTVHHSPSDTSEPSGTLKLKREGSGPEAPFKSQNPHSSSSDKRYFRFTFKQGFGKSDRSVFSAHGVLSESIYSALRPNEYFCKKMGNHFDKNILAYGQEAIEGYINLGMPLKCLPEGSQLEISVGRRMGSQKEDGQILRQYEDPNIECILFHVVAVGRDTKKIVKIKELHEKATLLCICALKGETVKEALCKDGRFRSDLDEFEWKLVEKHVNIYGKQSPVEEIAGKILELDISKTPSARKHTPKKPEQKNEAATGEIGPYDEMPSQNQVHNPQKDGASDDVEQDGEEDLPPRSLGLDIEGKKHRTISRIKSYYSDSCKRQFEKQVSHVQDRPLLRMECAIDCESQVKATDVWLKKFKILGKVIMECNPNFSEDARWMRNYFQEEQRRTKLPPFQQFEIYEKCFSRITKNSISVATCERHVHLSKSVGFMTWDNNGNTGTATCFVFRDGYIFTCRHVVHMMVGEGTDRSLWPGIISKCAKVTFTYKVFRPNAEEWFSIEPDFEVSDGDLDYAILKLRENGNGFPPGLGGQISSLPSSGLAVLIGHSEGRIKEIDVCAVITLKERSERYLELHQRQGGRPHITNYDVCSMFTPRSFPPKAYNTDMLSYDTCFTSGSSGSPVFNADGKVVALHAFGQFYKCGDKEHAFIEYAYSISSILCDLEQRNEPLHTLLTGEKCEGLSQGKNNKQELSLQDDWNERMEH